MKDKLMNMGVLAFGLSVALVLSPSNAAASDDDSLVDVRVLVKEDGKSSVLDVEMLDGQISGDVNADIPSESDEGSEALVSVEVSESAMDDLVVSVLEKTDSKASAAEVEVESTLMDDVTVDVVFDGKTPETEVSKVLATIESRAGAMDDLDVTVLEKTDSKASVATVETELALTGDVSVDVLSGEKTANAFVGGVVEANVEDLPVFGGTHVGVMGEHVTAGEEGQSFSPGLIQTDVAGDLLLDNANVDVLAAVYADDESVKSELSAVVDVSIDDDLAALDNLGVSVLKSGESGTEAKSSLASVLLVTPVTDGLSVDVASGGMTDFSFDGGLEVNRENAPLLGETHVGVLNSHLDADAEGKSLSAGLIQDVDVDLLEDASVGVLVRTATGDGQWVSESGASLDLGLSSTNTISGDVLTREPQFTIQMDNSTAVTAEDSVMLEVPGSALDEIENDEGTATAPENGGNSGDGSGNEEDGTANNNTGANDAIVEADQDTAAGNGLSGDVDADFGSGTGEVGVEIADASALKGQSSFMNSFAMNDKDSRSSLPKTGGFWDGNRLAFLALILMASGFVMRRMGKLKMSAV